MAHRKISQLQACDRGSAAIEFGISLPLLALLFVVVAEIGFTAYQSLQVQNAVEAGDLLRRQKRQRQHRHSTAVVNRSGLAGITATPAPTQFCGCPSAAGNCHNLALATCTGGNSSGQYVQINAALKRRSIFPGSGLPLPATLTAKSIVRLN